ncbi:MAG TPA: hypothetical protein VNU01_04565, partial [Egibacteraceae bacterium]|nr:hypothetical protein [Egibacteraceae bacterium]
VMGMIVTTVLLMGATFLLRARWQLPRHTLLFLFTGFALLMSGLHGFREVALVLPAALAGALADALDGQRASSRTIGVAVPTVLWLAWFATYAALWGLDWTPELWLGAVVFAALAGLGLSYLTDPPRALRALAPEAQPQEAEAPVPVAR